MKQSPLTIGLLITFAGVALMYWALVGSGIITGSTPQERYANTVAKIKG